MGTQASQPLGERPGRGLCNSLGLGRVGHDLPVGYPMPILLSFSPAEP